MIGITRCLALGGACDYSFVDEEAKYRGSEIHKCIELANKGKLDRKSVPESLKGYLVAYDRFITQNQFFPTVVEKNVENKELGLRGRLDCIGYMKKEQTLIEWKTGAIQPAVGLQMCLQGHLFEPGLWFPRVAVQLKPDGEYTTRHWKRINYQSDLTTALAFVRVAQWKQRENL